MFKKTLALLLALAISVGAAIGATALRNDKNDKKENVVQNQGSYTLNLQSGPTFPARQVTPLTFDIRTRNNNILKDFDIVHEKRMHLIIVRKDRSNFQHTHPVFDENSGVFELSPFIFPTEGEYRIFADFTPSSAQKGTDGTKLPVTIYQDVRVGAMDRYKPQLLGKDRLKSISNGFETGFFISADDDSSDTVGDTFYSGQSSVIVIYIDKNGQPYNNLQTYLGALGHMVVLGPKLEFIHAHPVNQDINNQQGLIGFEINFPDPGQYKVYLQTKANNRVSTFDYNLTVLAGSADQNG